MHQLALFTRPTDPAWPPEQWTRRLQVLDGQAVLANRHTDRLLIPWAKGQGLLVYIGRRSKWGNPCVLGRDGDRAAVVAAYRQYVAQQPALQADLAELAGRVLECFCSPQLCHGEVLLEWLETCPQRETAVAPLKLHQ